MHLSMHPRRKDTKERYAIGVCAKRAFCLDLDDNFNLLFKHIYSVKHARKVKPLISQ